MSYRNHYGNHKGTKDTKKIPSFSVLFVLFVPLW